MVENNPFSLRLLAVPTVLKTEGRVVGAVSGSQSLLSTDLGVPLAILFPRALIVAEEDWALLAVPVVGTLVGVDAWCLCGIFQRLNPSLPEGDVVLDGAPSSQ
jgi:hypothetical protein